MEEASGKQVETLTKKNKKRVRKVFKANKKYRKMQELDKHITAVIDELFSTALSN